MAFTDELDQMAADVAAVVNSATVTLKAIASGAWNSSTGVRTETVTSQSWLVNRLPVDPFSASAAPGGAAAGEERVFVGLASAVTIGTAGVVSKNTHRIVDDGEEFEVVHVGYEADRRFLRVTCRGLARGVP